MVRSRGDACFVAAISVGRSRGAVCPHRVCKRHGTSRASRAGLETARVEMLDEREIAIM